MATRDLKLRTCLDTFKGVGDLLAVANVELQSVADAYRRNLNRVNYLILFPPAAVQIAIQVQRATDEVDGMCLQRCFW